MDLQSLTTESANSRTSALDTMSVPEILFAMNDEDALVATAVRAEVQHIASAVELIVKARGQGGRLIYMGAGTSGRIGLLDAVECPPTFSTLPEEVQGLMAGGEGAFIRAAEGAEDQIEAGAADLAAITLSPQDVVVGLTASGRTPYVMGGLDYAQGLGAATISVSCNPGSEVSGHADVAIEVNTGPEVLTGSTRLKAGTAQKMVCNMLSTASMVRTGKVLGNLMVDVMPTNVKLFDRTQRIVAAATGATKADAEATLHQAGGSVKTAIVMLARKVSAAQAADLLTASAGNVRAASGITAGSF
ncbi:N-acetylmuramic acid 6-phosphate etherase [Arthrobacter sp. GMC3]|uniref:N-acetylmuramic acid 6-phosphate etherase n=1 Tax=Arthrobacter sp. GMC3 TaxID=2058894 RepID=UPI000CE4BE42|nr:N-acetylmuramic acid 6-phosphate etherase [Arthrobacter sp. GMC3]